MFSLFRKKFRRNLTLLVTAILLLHIVFVLGAFSYIIKKDYTDKALSFQMQYLNSLTLKMNAVQSRVKLYSEQYEYASSIERYDSQMINKLKKICNLSAHISEAFLLSDGGYAYYTQGRQKDMAQNPVIADVMYRTDPMWLCFPAPDTGEACLLYTISIAHDRYHVRLFADVSMELFQTHNKTIFQNGSEMLLYFNATDCALHIRNNSLTLEKSTGRSEDTAFAVTKTLVGKSIAVGIRLLDNYNDVQLFMYQMVVLCILIVFLAFFYIAMKAFSDKIVHALSGLCAKMDAFGASPRDYKT